MRILLLLSIAYMSCNQPEQKPTLQIEERYVLDNIPSGSGIVIDGGYAYIISDDATYLFKLSLSTKEYTSIPIHGMNTSLYRIPKPVKSDYEAFCKIIIGEKTFLAAFGSGSISPLRDSLLLIDMQNPLLQQKIPLTLLYQKLKKNNTVINIEGAACDDETLYLLDRESNNAYSISLISFTAYIKSGGKQVPENVSTQPLQFSGSVMTRISGASLLDNKRMLICASMEDTPDAIQDGKIHGSYIGFVNTADWKQAPYMLPLLSSDGIVLFDKIESVDMEEKYPDGSYKIWAVADNDNGNTILFALRLRFE